jgi:hypothetical protein
MANLSLDEKDNSRAFSTGSTVKIDVNGVSSFKPPSGSAWRLLSMYANIDLPAPGTAARENLARGGWRAWFQQKDSREADGRDETGYKGPIAIPRFGDMALLISHSWPHTVDSDPWEFCFKVYAYDSTGKAVSQSLKLSTRQVKIIEIG